MTVILGHAGLIAEARGFAPLLLLDEPAVHLDPARRLALYTALETAASPGAADRHRRRHVPAAGGSRGGTARRRRTPCRGPAFFPRSSDSPLSLDRCSGYIFRVSNTTPESPVGMSENAAPQPDSDPRAAAYDASSISGPQGAGCRSQAARNVYRGHG